MWSGYKRHIIIYKYVEVKMTDFLYIMYHIYLLSFQTNSLLIDVVILVISILNVSNSYSNVSDFLIENNVCYIYYTCQELCEFQDA